MPRMLLLVALMAGWTVGTLAPADELCEVDYRADVTYATVGGETLQMDIAMPVGVEGPVPGVLVIHGGGWMAGKRQDMTPLAKQLAQRGYVAATISYRLAPKHRYPAQIEDAKAAARYLRAHAKELKILPDRLGAVGGSAGAHLAMMLGVMDAEDGIEGNGEYMEHPSKVQAVVSFVGPTYLPRDSYNPAQTMILRAWLGDDPLKKQDVLKEASPLTYVNAGDAPLLCFFGSADPLVSYDQAFGISDALAKAGVPGRVELLLGAGHSWPEPEMSRTIAATIEFFDTHLKNKAQE